MYLILLCVVLAAADAQTDLKYIKICNETSPISLETMNEVLVHKKLEENRSSNFKCFLHCLFAKYGWMDEDGGFFVHQIKLALDEAQLETAALEFVLYKCTALVSVDKCERSFMFTECFWKRTQKDDEQLNLLDDRR